MKQRMRQYPFMIFLVVLFCLPLHAYTQDLSLPGIVPLVLENDVSVQIAGRSLSITRKGRKLLIAELLPQVRAGKAPLYTLSRSKDTLLGDEEELLIQGIGAEISITQALPTEGVLSFSISDTLEIVRQDDETSITQNPIMSVSLTQPLFVNKKIIDLSLFPARKKLSGNLPVSRAEIQDRAARNVGLLAAFEEYSNTLGLRKRLIQMDKSVLLMEKRLEQYRIRQKQGIVTATDVWEIELELEKLREERLELKYSLLQSEQTLARSLGIEEGIGDKALSEEIPEIEITGTKEEILNRVLSANPEIREKSLDLEKSRLQAIVNGAAYKSELSLSFSLEPEYALDRESSSDLQASFSDLFAEEAYLAPVVSIGLSVPVFNGGKAGIRRRIDQDSIVIARANLEAARRALQDQLDGLLLQHRMFEEKLDLVAENLQFKERRLEDQERLLALKTITPLEVEQVRIKRDEKEVELWQTRAKLFLIKMAILSLAGEDLQKILHGSKQ